MTTPHCTAVSLELLQEVFGGSSEELLRHISDQTPDTPIRVSDAGVLEHDRD